VVTKMITVDYPEGLHMRPAGVLVKEMGEFNSKVTILYRDLIINGKSLINILAACIKNGTEIKVEIDGDDEEEAMAKIQELFSTNFGLE